MIYNKIPVVFGGARKATGPEISYQYDVTQILEIRGLDLPEEYEVDFCNEGDSLTVTMYGNANGVEIPDDFLTTGKKIKAYVMLKGETEGAVETRYEITIPVNRRPARSDIQPTPAEQRQLDILMAAMTQAVDDSEDAARQAEAYVAYYPKVVNGNWYVWDVETETWVDTGYAAQGPQGVKGDTGYPTEQQIATATGNWLGEHVDPETGYVLDTSLTVEGAAADAKAVGDALIPISKAQIDALFD